MGVQSPRGHTPFLKYFATMNKEVSMVRVDTRGHRRIAQENWGLSDEQMKGMHVHHRVPRSRGGANDPSNLYVCSAWFHKNVWHAEDSFRNLVQYAVEGGYKAYEMGVGIHGRTPEQKHEDAVKAGNAGGWKKSQEKGTGIFGDRAEWRDAYVESGKKSLARLREKDPEHNSKAGKLGAQKLMELGKGIHAPGVAARGGAIAGRIAVESGQLARARTPESIRKGAIAAANTKWMDPDHPELGIHNAGVLVRKQRKLGLPSEKANRVKVG